MSKQGYWPKGVQPAGLGRVKGQPLKRSPGHTANLRKLIDQHFGHGAEDAIQFLADVVKGRSVIPARAPGRGEDSVSVALIPMVPPTFKEKIEAARTILAYRYGLPHQHVSVEAPPADVPQMDYEALSDEELEQLERLTEKATPASEAVVDAEVSEAEDHDSPVEAPAEA